MVIIFIYLFFGGASVKNPIVGFKCLPRFETPAGAPQVFVHFQNGGRAVLKGIFWENISLIKGKLFFNNFKKRLISLTEEVLFIAKN